MSVANEKKRGNGNKHILFLVEEPVIILVGAPVDTALSAVEHTYY